LRLTLTTSGSKMYVILVIPNTESRKEVMRRKAQLRTVCAEGQKNKRRYLKGEQFCFFRT
jgi:hypothetical protein